MLIQKNKLLCLFLSLLFLFSPLIDAAAVRGFGGRASAEQDLTVPIVDITSPTDSSIVGNTGDIVTINANASVDMGVTKVEFYVDETLVGDSVYAPYSYNWQASVGNHSLCAKAYDAAGNIGSSASINVIVLTQLTINNPANGSTLNGTYTNFSATTSDAVYNAELYIDDILRASVNPNSTNISFDYNWDTGQYSNGSSHTIKVIATPSGSSNPSTVINTVTVNNTSVDTTPPNVSASPAGGIYNTPVNVTLSSDETANIYYTLDGSEPTTSGTLYNSSIAIDTNKTLKYLGQDTSGNISPVNTENYVIDTTAPNINISSPIDGERISGTVNFEVYTSDAVGIDKVEFYIDGVKSGEDTVAPFVYSWDTSSAIGSHILLAKAYDLAGNNGTSNSVSVTVAAPDTTPPVINADPIGGVFNTPINVSLSSDENATTYYTIDGSDPTTASPIYNTPINISSNKTLKYFGKDTSGNISAIKTQSYVIDTTGPTVTITTPANGSSVKGTQSVQVDASDSLGISKIDLYIDNTVKSTSSTSPLTYNWDTSLYTEGLHTVSATVYDTIYNSSTVLSNVYVDRTAPVISNIVITTTSADATITWKTNEPADSQIEWGPYNKWGNLSPLDSNLVTNHSVVITGLNPGSYYNFRIRTKDGAQNLATYDKTLVGTKSLTAPYIRNWILNGPHENTQTSVLQTDYLNGEDLVLPSERQVQSSKTWAKIVSTTDSINISNIYYSGQYAAYAHTYVNSPTQQDVLLWIGGQAGYKVWLNGTVVLNRDKTAQEGYTSQSVNVRLNAGWNKLLIKISDLGGVSKFDVRFSNQNGSAVTGLTYQLNDPANGTPPTDVIAPTISDPSSSVTSSTATIKWLTSDEASDTKVLYGLTESYGSTAYAANRVINHSIQLTVEADRTYHYQIVSTDAFGNVVMSPDYTFTTTPGTAPYIKSYLVNGIYTNGNASTGLATDFLGGEALAEPCEGEGTASAGKDWTLLSSTGDYIDLAQKFGTAPDTVVYSHFYLSKDSPSDLNNHQIWLGSTGGIKVWLNGNLILDKNVSRAHKFGDDRINIVIRPGLNKILIKSTPGDNGQFGFSARITQTDGYRYPLTDYPDKYYTMDDPVAVNMSNGEWLQVFYAEKGHSSTTRNSKGLYIRKSYNDLRNWYPSSLAISEATAPSMTRSDNSTLLAYKKLVNSVDQVFMQVYYDNGSWGAPIALTSGTASVYRTQIYKNKENNLTYVFYSYDDGSLWYRSSSDLLSWSSAVRVGRDIGKNISFTKPFFSIVKQNGSPWSMIWYDPSIVEEVPNVANTYDYPVVKFANSADLQSWSEANELILPFSERLGRTRIDKSDLCLSEDGAGTLYMSYTGEKSYGYFKYSTDDGNTWSKRFLISKSAAGDTSEKFNASLATDSSGQMYSFYSTLDNINGVPIPFRYIGPLTSKNVLGFKPGIEGEGINPATGNYTYNNGDMNIPGRGIPITIDRTYNSLEASIPGPFGYGWTFNYNVKLTTDINGNVTIISGDGRYDQYTKLTDGTTDNYIPYPGVSGVLTKNVNGSWKLTQMDRNVLNFDNQGKLISLVDANSNITSLSYDAQGKLVGVTDAAGRALTLSYNASGYISSIATDIPSFDQWTVNYSYTGDDLTGVTEADGHSWNYSYFDTTHRIKDITDPRGNFLAQLTYNTDGKVAAQLDAEGRNVNLLYGAGRTDITDNETQKTKYFDDKFNIVKQEDSDGVTNFGYDLQGNMSSITDPKGNSTAYFYDPNGMLAKAVDADGNTTKNNYNINGDLVLEVDPTGNKTTNTYDAKGNLLTTNSGGSLLTYNYDQYGQLTSVADAENNQTIFTYDPNNYGYVVKSVTNSVYNLSETTYDGIGRTLTEQDGNGLTAYDFWLKSHNIRTVTDGRNNVTTYEYDNNHNMIKEINALGKEKVYDYNKLNQLTSVTDEVYNTVSYGYDLFGNQTTITDVYGNSSTRVYDDFKRVLSSTDFNGNTTLYSYDAGGNMKTVTDPEGGVTELFYDNLNRVNKIKDPNGNFSEITYDTMGRVITNKNGAGNIIQNTYDALGRLETVRDGKGNTVTNTYDTLGRTKRITYPDNSYVEYEYDPMGNVISFRDQISRITLYTYDQYNRLTSVTNPFGNIMTPAYDAAGNTESVTLTTPEGEQFGTVSTYDQLNRVSSQTELPGNLVTSIEYNDNGTVKAVQNPKLNKTSYTYDKLNRVNTITNAEEDTVTFEYDKMGNRTKIIDGEGKFTTFNYDRADRLVSVQDAVYAADPLHHETVYTYDPNGNLKFAKNGLGNITEFGYDGANRLLLTKDPLGNLTSYEYDIAGYVYRRTDANGNAVMLSYDTMNRINKVTFPDGKTIDYTYDSLGNLTRMVDSTGTVDYSYNKGQIDTVSYARNGIDVKYEYDSLGNLTNLNALKGTDNIYSSQYRYNDRNLVDQLTDDNGNNYSFSYDALGNITQILYPNNTVATFDYDNANRVKNITDAVYGGASFLTYDYLYDGNGRRTQMTVNGTGISSYEYDAIGQLAQVVDSRGTTTYNYDGAGNRIQMNGPGGNINYTYDAANRLTQAGNVTYGYDNNGNRISKSDTNGTTTYDYDFNNRLLGINTPSGMVNYTYDGLGTLLSRDSSVSGAVYYLNNGLNTLLESDTADYAASTKYALGVGGLLGQVAPDATTQYYYYDALGSLGAIGDQAGNVNGSYRYDPYGAVIQQSGSTESNRNFVGKYGVTAEPEDGLTHMGARFYDASAGAFLQTDPVAGSITNPLSMVPYIYAWNDPVNLIDPNGEMPSSGWFTRKQREWGTTAQRLQGDLNSGGFTGKNGGKLAIDGKYGENTLYAHWNYYLFRELKNNGYYPQGESYIINFKTDRMMKFKQWFGGKVSSVSIRGLQGFLKKENATGFNGETVYADGRFGPTTRQAVISYFWQGSKQIAASSNGKSNPTNQGTGNNGGTVKTGAKYSGVQKDEEVKRQGIKNGAIGAVWAAVDSTVEDVAKVYGKKVTSTLGAAANGVLTGLDIGETLNNNKYTTSQKYQKATIQFVAGAVDVAGGTAIFIGAAALAPESAGTSFVLGASGAGYLSYNVNLAQNWAYRELDL